MTIALKSAIVDCSRIRFPLQERDVVDLWTVVSPIVEDSERFFPRRSVFVRKEMCDVFSELTKMDRKQQQILIGSPGVGKSILLFFVAIYRALTDAHGRPVVFIRKTFLSQELTSVFFMEKSTDDPKKIIVSYNRSLRKRILTGDIAIDVINLKTDLEDPLKAIVDDRIWLFLDGPHEGDEDVKDPHHYLSTSGGFDNPQGESSRFSTLVVLGGWLKESLLDALSSSGILQVQMNNEMEAGGQARAEVEESNFRDAFEEIYYHTGGRIREAVDFTRDPSGWKRDRESTISKISKENVLLSLIETKGSADMKSADRLRTMFRDKDGDDFMSCLQIVDSQFYAHLLQNRAGLDEYFNAYQHAKRRGLTSAAGCHFEELLHQLFSKRPKPITSFTQGTGTGAEGVQQLQDYSSYWIPSTPNFANIDAAIFLDDDKDQLMEAADSEEAGANEVGESDSGGSHKTLWCFQYTVSSSHTFNATTFRTKFLRPVLANFQLRSESVTVKIVFVVPADVYSSFIPPGEVEDSGFDGDTKQVDCSSVGTVEDFLKEMEFIESPVSYAPLPTEPPAAMKTSAAPAPTTKRVRSS